jgi:hypothetical protein
MPERFQARPRPLFARVLGLACALVAGLGSLPAVAYYEEAHVTGDEVRVTVDTAGSARVEHTVSWQIVAGQYHFLDLGGLPGGLSAEPVASLVGEDGRVFPATLAEREGNVLRVAFEEPKGLRHGHYKVRFAYREDLVSNHAFTRDGAMWRLSWQSPPFSDGYDGAVAIFDLPPSIDEPRLVGNSNEAVDLGILSTSRRSEDKDELELVKPHVARHEVLTWTLRVAPHAFPGVHDPSLRPPPASHPAVVRRGPSPIVVFLGALAAALLYSGLVRKKSVTFDRACREVGVRAEGLVPLALELRSALSGLCLGAGILVEWAGAPTLGGGCVAVAMLMATLRPPKARRAPPRGPGRWLALRPAEAFHEPKVRDWFDPKTLPGASAALATLALIGALGGGLGRLLFGLDPHTYFLIVLESIALLPLVATGRDSQLPPRLRSKASWFCRLFHRLAKERSLRVAPWVRVPTGCAEPDELRVLVMPRAAMPGLVGIEIGLSAWHSATCYGTSPEILVRVHEATAASARMTTLAVLVRPVPGRLPEERVYRLVPRLPTRDGTARLVRRLGRELEDRRFGAIPWSREERRVPPATREAAFAGAA